MSASPVTVLGGLSPTTFLRDYWQKRPLLVRQAIPGFAGVAGVPNRDALLTLATRADAISRLVIAHPGRRGRTSRWERHDGPFGAIDASMLPPSHWTMLVHGVESLVPGGWELLRQFSFIPAARIDDLMVSYATDGGSVGPHEDQYDVFLLQGPGRRRWQVSTRGDHVFDAGAAIKVLKNFVPEDEWLLEPGDMLYLPPGVAHWGVAEGPCFTYSIGFLAPSHRDLMQSFLGYLQQALAGGIDEHALYADRDLRLQKEPVEIGDAMVERVASVLGGAIRWDKADVEEFLGRFLTMPKPRFVFAPPARPLSAEAFARRLRGGSGSGRQGGRIVLALPTRGLVRGRTLFLNGEAHQASRATVGLFKQLVSDRALSLPLSPPVAAKLDDHALELLHSWYVAGYLLFDVR